MYDLFTVALLFVVLSPGVVLNLGTSALMAALIHAVVFYLVLRFVSAYVPWWGVWIIAGLAIGGKLYASSRPVV
jgi:hypothetical protein